MKNILLVFIGLILFNLANAQDVIFKKNGDEIKAKIQEVGVTEVKYKKFESQDGPVYSILKTDVFMIKYENGTKDVFTSDASTNVSNNNASVSTEPASKEPATVIIYRPNSPSGWAVVYDVYADEKYLTKIKNNTYFEAKLDAGNVVFSAMTEAPKVTLPMNLEPGKTYYVRCGVSTGIWVGRPSLQVIPETQGLKETSRMKK
ncbi:MAG: DUF2846 domain-containing protein [Bacteroidota bacterium]